MARSDKGAGLGESVGLTVSRRRSGSPTATRSEARALRVRLTVPSCGRCGLRSRVISSGLVEKARWCSGVGPFPVKARPEKSPLAEKVRLTETGLEVPGAVA